MCLIVDDTYHLQKLITQGGILDGYGSNVNSCECVGVKPIPIVAACDILVYKLLRKKGEHWRTPVMECLVPFRKGVQYMHSKLECPTKTENFDSSYCGKTVFIVNNGIHAYSDNDNDSLAYNLGFLFFDRKRVFSAVIPKGAKFYIGNNHDIVSNELIVYKDKKKLNYKKCMTFENYKKTYIKT